MSRTNAGRRRNVATDGLLDELGRYSFSLGVLSGSGTIGRPGT